MLGGEGTNASTFQMLSRYLKPGKMCPPQAIGGADGAPQREHMSEEVRLVLQAQVGIHMIMRRIALCAAEREMICCNSGGDAAVLMIFSLVLSLLLLLLLLLMLILLELYAQWSRYWAVPTTLTSSPAAGRLCLVEKSPASMAKLGAMRQLVGGDDSSGSGSTSASGSGSSRTRVKFIIVMKVSMCTSVAVSASA